MKRKQKGVLLFCTLVIMVILSVFLMVGVYRMQSSTMVTKKAVWEIKSYWAARAGNTIAADGCLRSRRWPDTVDPNAFLKSAGGYTIAKNGSMVIGRDDSSDSAFSIYYINHLLSNPSKKFSSENVLETALQKKLDDMKTKYDDRDAEYNKAWAEYIAAKTANKMADMNKARDKMYDFLVQELYALTVGKSGPSICGLEFIYGLNTGGNVNKIRDNEASPAVDPTGPSRVSVTAAVRVNGAMNVTTNNLLHVDQTVGSRPSLIANSVSISSVKNSDKPNSYGAQAVDMGEGTIFTNTCSINGQPITPSYSSSNISSFGVNVFPLNNTDLSVGQPKQIPTETAIPSGTFCFIQMPDSYSEEEFRATCASVKELYFDPDDFYDLYIKPHDDALGKLVELVSNALDLITFTGIKSDSIDMTHCNLSEQKAYEIFEEYFKDRIEEVGDKCHWASESDAKTNYRNYLYAHLNTLINSYTKATLTEDSTYGEYEPFFIPAGYLGVNGKLDYDNWNDFISSIMNGTYGSLYFSYQNLTKSRIYSNFADSLDEHTGIKTENTRLASLFKGLFTAGVDEAEEKSRLKSNFESKLQKEHGDYYLCKKIDTKDGYINVMEKLKDYQFGTDDKSRKLKNDVAQKMSFISNKEALLMKIDTSLGVEDNGFFNFATFERKEDNYSYSSAQNRRAGIVFNKNAENENVSKCGIKAKEIDIKGTVEGTGTLQSTNGDIIFEAVGSGLEQDDNYVALLANGNIKLKQVSAGNAILSWGDKISRYRGVFQSTGNLKIEGKDLRTFSLVGTVICGGNMDVEGVDNFYITYDPKLSGIVLQYIDNAWTDTFDYMEEAIENDPYEETSYEDNNPSDNNYVYSGTFKLFNRI